MTYGMPNRFGFAFMREFTDKVSGLHGRSMANGVEQAMREINSAEDRIRVNLIWLKDKCDSIESSLNDSRSLNELGEFQGNGAGEIDRMCALRAQAWTHLSALLTREELKELQDHRNVEVI